MFRSNFNISEERTRRWIRDRILENPNAILFMIYVNGKKVGNLGTDKFDEKTNSAELENYMKDPTFEFPGLMTIVERPYLKWMFDGLKLSKIVTHVFSDNDKIINVHIRCGGWRIAKVIPLKRVFTSDGWKWEKTELKSEDGFAERYFNKMEVTRKDLMKNFEDINYEILG